MKKLLLLFLLLFVTTYADKTPHEDLFRKSEKAIIFSPEFLFWTVQTGALDYAIKMKQPTSLNNNYALGDYQIADYGWDPGFRIGVGYYNAPKYWEVRGQYTYQRITGKDETNKPKAINEFLTGTWPQLIGLPIQKATSSIRLLYNIVDLLTARVFIPNPHFRMKLFGGLTGAFIGQKWEINYTDNSDGQTRIRNRFRFRGVGPKVGLTLDWFWSNDFYITGIGSFANMIGRYVNRSFQDLNDQTIFRDMAFKDIRLILQTQFILGPSYQKSFCQSRIEIFAGYELTEIFNLQEIYRSTFTPPSSAKETWLNRSLFALHGLTVRASLDF